jgi:hypothetical protein
MRRHFRRSNSVNQGTSEQLPAGDDQIGQRTGHEQSIGVLRDAAVAQLGAAKYALQNTNGVLDLGAQLRLCSVLRPLSRGQFSVRAVRGSKVRSGRDTISYRFWDCFVSNSIL